MSGKWIQIPKGNGRVRHIYVPTEEEKSRLDVMLPKLRRICYLRLKRLDLYKNIHGFWPGRSPVTAALMHVGAKSAFSLDLENFFDHCTYERFVPLVKYPDEFRSAFRKHPVTKMSVAAQGLPTSPMISNLCFTPIDAELKQLASKNTLTYTRYADDLTFSSCDENANLKSLVEAARKIIEQHGFPIAQHKIRLWRRRSGRLIVCGVGVDETGVYPTRRMKRRLRAALHQRKEPQARGLAEWCSLKLPRAYLYNMAARNYYHCGSGKICANSAGPHLPEAVEELRRTRPPHEVIRIVQLMEEFSRFSIFDCRGVLLRAAAHPRAEELVDLMQKLEARGITMPQNVSKMFKHSLVTGNVDEAIVIGTMLAVRGL
jgi:hypothetical protein